MPEGLRVERVGAIATLTLDRPSALNALTVPLKIALRETLEGIAADRGVRAVVLTGAGRGFCAGQDLAERESPDAAPLDVELRERYHPIIRALRTMPQPVVAAINGVAAGAGASLALACDLRIASTDARFVLAFGRIGLTPDSGLSWLLPRIVGVGRAAELALVGDPVGAEDALRIGLVHRVVAADALIDESLALAERLAGSAPRAIAATKAALDAGEDGDLDAALEREATLQGQLGRTLDHAEGLLAFREKRPPRFTGT